jgi:hypothetical protein
MAASRTTLLALILVSLVCLYPLPAANPQNAPQLLPTGMWITPTAAKGTVLQPLNPGLPTFPDFAASMGVSTAVSPDGNTLLVLTSGYNQNYNASGNTEAATSNEYLFVYDISADLPS